MITFNGTVGNRRETLVRERRPVRWSRSISRSRSRCPVTSGTKNWTRWNRIVEGAIALVERVHGAAPEQFVLAAARSAAFVEMAVAVVAQAAKVAKAKLVAAARPKPPR